MRLLRRETLPPAGFARPSSETPRRVGRGAIICTDSSERAASRPSAADRSDSSAQIIATILRAALPQPRAAPGGFAASLRLVTGACFPPPAGCVFRVAQAPKEIRGAFALLHWLGAASLPLAPRSLPRGLGKERERHGVLLACSRSVAGVSERQAGSGRLPRCQPDKLPGTG
jgi:hypothetical protein